MSNKNAVTHTEPRVIAGIFRETLLSRREILLQTENERVWTRIEDITEKTQRDKGSLRTFIVRHDVNNSTERLINVTIPFGRFIFTGTTTHSIDTNALNFPLEMVQSTKRQFERFKVRNLNSGSKVALVQEADTVLCEFSLEEFSQDTIKGLLHTPFGHVLSLNTLLTGRIQTADGPFKVDGIISRITEIVSGDDQVYRVVVTQSRNRFARVSALELERKERRNQKRAVTDVSYRLTSPVINGGLDLSIQDISLASFKAVPKEQLDLSKIIFGIEYVLENQEVKVRLVSSRNDELVFSVTEASDAGRKWWFNEYSKALQPSLFTGEVDSADVLRLFCESGSFSPNYIKGSRSDLDRFQSGIKNIAENATWLHRWLEIKEGRAVGYISAVRITRKIWGIIDLAGSQDPLNKMSKDFTVNFLHAFSRYLVQFFQKSSILMIWVDKHPYWNLLEKRVNEKPAYIFFSGYLNYSRITGEEESHRVKDDPTIKCSLLEQGAIEAVNNRELNSNIQILKSLFDTDDEKVSSGHRSLLFRVEGPLTPAGTIAGVIEIPEGSSLNRVVQTLFICPLDDTIDQTNWKAIKQSALGFCYLNGFYPSSVRRLLPNKVDSKLLLGEQATMRMVSMSPHILDDYENTP